MDAYYDPTIQSDLAAFSSQFGLAPLNGQNGNGTFTQVDLSNKTLSPSNDDWTIETALDVEWRTSSLPGPTSCWSRPPPTGPVPTTPPTTCCTRWTWRGGP